jgi:hypothetical protein
MFSSYEKQALTAMISPLKMWKSRLNCEMMWKIRTKSRLKSEKIWKIWKKIRLNCEKI